MRYIIAKGTTPQYRACTDDRRFTYLPIMSVTGDPVCCVVIFQTKDGKVPMLWHMGVDIRHESPVCSPSGKVGFEGNLGEGMHYPGGPKCKYNGKWINCLTYGTPSGGITGKVLVKILRIWTMLGFFHASQEDLSLSSLWMATIAVLSRAS